MIRNYKVLGVAMVAMLALSAFVAQTASAKSLTTTDNLAFNGVVYTTGSQETTFVFNNPAHGGGVQCKEVHYLGEGTATSGSVVEQTVKQVYETNTKSGETNCTAFGFANTHVIANGCTFTFTEPGTIAGGVTWSNQQAHLTCPTGQSITITPTFAGVSVCTQHIAPQTPTGGHTVGTNISDNNKMGVTLDVKVTGIHYIGTGGNCGPNGVTTTDGTLTGAARVTCYSDSARTVQIGCTFS